MEEKSLPATVPTGTHVSPGGPDGHCRRPVCHSAWMAGSSCASAQWERDWRGKPGAGDGNGFIRGLRIWLLRSLRYGGAPACEVWNQISTCLDAPFQSL